MALNLSDVLSTVTGNNTNITPTELNQDAILHLHPSAGAEQSNINFFEDDGLTLLASIVSNTTTGFEISSESTLSLQGLIWPNVDGNSGQVLTTDGIGNLSWQDQTGGSGNYTSKDNTLTPTNTFTDIFSSTGIKSVKWIITIEDLINSKMRCFEVLAMNKFGTAAQHNVGTLLGDRNIDYSFDVTISGGNFMLQITNNESNDLKISVLRITL